MPVRVNPFTRSFHPDRVNFRIPDERVENPHGVGTSPNTGHHRAGKHSLDLQDLLPGLPPDDRLEIPDHSGEGVGSHHRSDDVVGILYVGDPIPDRLVGGILQGPGPGRHRTDLGPEKLHAVDVQGLPGYVLLPHVDHAVQAKEGSRRWRWLPRAGRPPFRR